MTAAAAVRGNGRLRHDASSAGAGGGGVGYDEKGPEARDRRGGYTRSSEISESCNFLPVFLMFLYLYSVFSWQMLRKSWLLIFLNTWSVNNGHSVLDMWSVNMAFGFGWDWIFRSNEDLSYLLRDLCLHIVCLIFRSNGDRLISFAILPPYRHIVTRFIIPFAMCLNIVASA
jgi:hypothetical protein